MNVLIVGSGGREHAITWKIASSRWVDRLYVAPGNAGTATLAENVDIQVDDIPALVKFAQEAQVGVVVIGPEAPLAMGLADALRQAGIRAFGPAQTAARIESSKAFAKAFMARWGIPTARFATFSDYDAAAAYLDATDYPVVIKASGLAAGKGVIIPAGKQDAHAALKAILVGGEFGAAGNEVVIEERLEGEEVSLMAFTDGTTVRTMPPAQDHKRLLDGDRGPNTGGMGAYAPAPACPPQLVRELTKTFLVPAVEGLRQEGNPFSGVLYAGLILTSAGPRVLEYNARFGDPETQAVLPLLETDLLEVINACVDGSLAGLEVRWKPEAAACVVLASENYPAKPVLGREIHGLDRLPAGTYAYHAGTRLDDDRVLSAGGRVLGVTATGLTLQAALRKVYQAVVEVHFEGMQYRRDISWRAEKPASAYTQAGVSIDAGNRAVNLMKTAVRSTYGPEVLAGIGAFGGLYDAAAIQGYRSPVLVASTDGVGTKVKLAAQAGSFRSIGMDLVNHCINDILVQGARPLFFLDYFAASRLQPEVAAEVVSGIAGACRAAGCALIGGETAEMPGVYAAGEFDLAGTIVGLVERDAILPRADIRAGDVLVGLRSSGPHTNGYSLIRKVFEGDVLTLYRPELGRPLGEALLAPHRSYLDLLWPVLSGEPRMVKGLAHLTGGGFVENIPRILPEELGACIRLGSWTAPPLFRLIQERGGIAAEEMYRVFNMGIGMVAVVAAEDVSRFQAALPEETWVIGEVTAGDHRVRLENA